MHLRITHRTEYGYWQEAWDSFNELRLRPADDYRQTLHAYDLRITPRAEVRSRRDHVGNLVQHFHLHGRHEHLAIESVSTVETYPVPAPIEVRNGVLPGLRHRFFEFLAPTDRVPLDRDWHEVMGALPLVGDIGLVAYVGAMTEYLQGRFTYQPDATTVDTPLEEFVRSGSGVCQDYTHGMLALCRLAGIPARYVSGYVHADPEGSEALLGSEGSHAWVEVFLAGNGWVGYDPTNGCPIGEAHVKLAVGRDYDDVPPVKGLRRGGGPGTLTVTVRVRRADADGLAPDAGVPMVREF